MSSSSNEAACTTEFCSKLKFARWSSISITQQAVSFLISSTYITIFQGGSHTSSNTLFIKRKSVWIKQGGSWECTMYLSTSRMALASAMLFVASWISFAWAYSRSPTPSLIQKTYEALPLLPLHAPSRLHLIHPVGRSWHKILVKLNLGILFLQFIM